MTSFARGTIVVGLALLVWLALDLLLLLFAGVLLAIFLRTLASELARRSGLRVGWSLAIVVLLIVGSVWLAGWAYAPSLAEQSDQLTQAIPMAVADLTSWLRQYGWGQWLLDQTGVSDGKSAGATLAEQAVGGGTGDVVTQVTTAARRLLDFGVAVVVMGFTGLYLAAEPAPYVRGVLLLIPRARRRRAAEVLYATAHVLRWWLLGQALAMVVVGLAMGIGLGLIGVQLAFILGVLAGLFEFIPFLGPLLALGPALLIALASSTTQAAYVLILYGIVQTFEGYVLTPLVQRKAVELPPVMTIAAQVALSWAAGPIGLLVAVPLVAVLMVWTQMLYVDDRLGDRVAPEVEETAREEFRRDESTMLRGLLPAPA
jgi:predicted PurR-regulated permease PerM